MTVASDGRAVAGDRAVSGACPPRPPSERAPEVSWFDIRDITLGRADLADLDAREAARAAAFMFAADRHRYQVAHVMLRRVLARYLGAEPRSLAFGRHPCPTCGGPSGKPVLTGSGLSFSLAHSADAVVIAVAGQPVGVDVEREAAGCVCSLASAMHPSDAAAVGPLPEPERHTEIIRWWVRAEAMLKCAGTGIRHGMSAFPVLGGAAGYSVAALAAPMGYQAAVALRPGSLAPEAGGGP
jgi:4'-phosphopantetheinyl transferase